MKDGKLHHEYNYFGVEEDQHQWTERRPRRQTRNKVRIHERWP